MRPGLLVGASNALAAYVKYAGKVPPQSLTVLVYMALVSKDADERPWFGAGHEALAQHALGRPGPTTLADLPDSVRIVPDPSVERAGAVAETGPRRIDAQLMAALERVQKVLAS